MRLLVYNIDIMEQSKVIVRCMTYNQKNFIRDALDGLGMQNVKSHSEQILSMMPLPMGILLLKLIIN